jgi:hypothetical protein
MLTARYVERLKTAPRFVSRQLFGGARIENVGAASGKHRI